MPPSAVALTRPPTRALAVAGPLSFTAAHALVRARHRSLPLKPWGVAVNWTVCLWRTVIKTRQWAMRRTGDRHQHLGRRRVMADIGPQWGAKPMIGPVIETMIMVRRVLKPWPENRVWHWIRGGLVPVNPALALRVPRAKPVVIIPVAADAEGNDANAEGSAIGEQRNACALVRVDDVARIQPAAMGADGDIAPAVIAHAAFNGDGNATAQDGHNRIIAGRPGPQVDLFGHISQLLSLHLRCQRGQGGRGDRRGQR